MRWLATAIALLVLGGCQTKKSASLHIDPTLESLVPADTVMIAGANLDAIRATPVYNKLSSRLPLPQLEEFSRQTGLDPRKDLSQVLSCGDGQHALLMARGKFRPADLEARLKSNGATEFGYKSRRLLGNEQSAAVFLNDSTVLAGAAAELRSVIDHNPSSGGLPSSLAELLRSLPGNDQIYAAIIGGLDGLNLSSPRSDLLGNLAQMIQAIDSAAVGIDLSQGVNLIAHVNSKTERDAKFVHDIVRGLVGFGRLNAPVDQPDLLKLYDAVQVTQQQTQTVIKADVPADQVDRVLDLLAEGSHSPGSSSPRPH